MSKTSEALTPTELKIETTRKVLFEFIANSNIDDATKKGLCEVILAYTESLHEDYGAFVLGAIKDITQLSAKMAEMAKEREFWKGQFKKLFRHVDGRDYDDFVAECQAAKSLSTNTEVSTSTTIGEDEMLDFEDMLREAEKRKGS